MILKPGNSAPVFFVVVLYRRNMAAPFAGPLYQVKKAISDRICGFFEKKLDMA
jgi:hypothetical protein